MAGENINISGIKCDSLTCDYCDDNVHVNGYEDWLNKPCPKCGSNLLTQADYDMQLCLLETVRLENLNSPVNNTEEPIFEVNISMNGSGYISIENLNLLTSIV